MGKDKFLGGLIKGKSDPYGVLEVGTNVFRSKIIHETVNPKWNEVFEVGLQLAPSVQTLCSQIWVSLLCSSVFMFGRHFVLQYSVCFIY